MHKLFKRLTCYIEDHDWSEPVADEEMTIKPPHLAMKKWGEQNGHRVCRYCGARQQMIRAGFVGDSFFGPTWQEKP